MLHHPNSKHINTCDKIDIYVRRFVSVHSATSAPKFCTIGATIQKQICNERNVASAMFKIGPVNESLLCSALQSTMSRESEPTYKCNEKASPQPVSGKNIWRFSCCLYSGSFHGYTSPYSYNVFELAHTKHIWSHAYRGEKKVLAGGGFALPRPPAIRWRLCRQRGSAPRPHRLVPPNDN